MWRPAEVDVSIRPGGSPSGRGRARAFGRQSRGSVFQLRRPEREAAAQRSADARRSVARDGRRAPHGISPAADVDVRARPRAEARRTWRVAGRSATLELALAQLLDDHAQTRGGHRARPACREYTLHGRTAARGAPCRAARRSATRSSIAFSRRGPGVRLRSTTRLLRQSRLLSSFSDLMTATVPCRKPYAAHPATLSFHDELSAQPDVLRRGADHAHGTRPARRPTACRDRASAAARATA